MEKTLINVIYVTKVLMNYQPCRHTWKYILERWLLFVQNPEHQKQNKRLMLAVYVTELIKETLNSKYT
jgi:hypothetical protein